MINESNYNRRPYSQGRVEEFCRNDTCGWREARKEENGYEDLEKCPVCGGMTDSAIYFGGLIVHYNRMKENFTLSVPGNEWQSAYVDNADAPDTIQFMLRRFPFKKWW